jgi:hypothetical protein
VKGRWMARVRPVRTRKEASGIYKRAASPKHGFATPQTYCSFFSPLAWRIQPPRSLPISASIREGTVPELSDASASD